MGDPAVNKPPIFDKSSVLENWGSPKQNLGAFSWLLDGCLGYASTVVAGILSASAFLGAANPHRTGGSKVMTEADRQILRDAVSRVFRGATGPLTVLIVDVVLLSAWIRHCVDVFHFVYGVFLDHVLLLICCCSLDQHCRHLSIDPNVFFRFPRFPLPCSSFSS